MLPTTTISELYRDMYDGGAMREWRDAGALSKADNVARACQTVGLPAISRVVELGCGEGALAAELMRRAFADSYLGLDVSPSGINAARARSIVGAEFVLYGGGRVPVADRSSDLVILSHVLEHLEHPRVLLYEAKRISNHVLVEVPLELNGRTPLDYEVDALGHINKYSARSIRHLVQSCGFSVVAQFTTNPAHAGFGDTSWNRRWSTGVKDLALRASPRMARGLFTFHETLLLRS